MSTIRKRRKGCSFPTRQSSLVVAVWDLLGFSWKEEHWVGRVEEGLGQSHTYEPGLGKAANSRLPPALLSMGVSTWGCLTPRAIKVLGRGCCLCTTGYLFSSTSGLNPFCVKTWYLKLSLDTVKQSLLGEERERKRKGARQSCHWKRSQPLQHTEVAI